LIQENCFRMEEVSIGNEDARRLVDEGQGDMGSF
jgi:hypothetical protein